MADPGYGEVRLTLLLSFSLFLFIARHVALRIQTGVEAYDAHWSAYSSFSFGYACVLSCAAVLWVLRQRAWQVSTVFVCLLVFQGPFDVSLSNQADNLMEQGTGQCSWVDLNDLPRTCLDYAPPHAKIHGGLYASDTWLDYLNLTRKDGYDLLQLSLSESSNIMSLATSMWPDLNYTKCVKPHFEFFCSNVLASPCSSTCENENNCWSRLKLESCQSLADPKCYTVDFIAMIDLSTGDTLKTMGAFHIANLLRLSLEVAKEYMVDRKGECKGQDPSICHLGNGMSLNTSLLSSGSCPVDGVRNVVKSYDRDVLNSRINIDALYTIIACVVVIRMWLLVRRHNRPESSANVHPLALASVSQAVAKKQETKRQSFAQILFYIVFVCTSIAAHAVFMWAALRLLVVGGKQGISYFSGILAFLVLFSSVPRVLRLRAEEHTMAGKVLATSCFVHWRVGGRYYLVRLALFEIVETLVQFQELHFVIAQQRDYTEVVVFALFLSLNLMIWIGLMAPWGSSRGRKKRGMDSIIRNTGHELVSDIVFISLSAMFADFAALSSFASFFAFGLPIVSVMDVLSTLFDHYLLSIRHISARTTIVGLGAFQEELVRAVQIRTLRLSVIRPHSTASIAGAVSNEPCNDQGMGSRVLDKSKQIVNALKDPKIITVGCFVLFISLVNARIVFGSWNLQSECREQLGDCLWEGMQPRVMWEDGIFSTPKCYVNDLVKSIDLSSCSMDGLPKSLQVITAYEELIFPQGTLVDIPSWFLQDKERRGDVAIRLYPQPKIEMLDWSDAGISAETAAFFLSATPRLSMLNMSGNKLSNVDPIEELLESGILPDLLEIDLERNDLHAPPRWFQLHFLGLARNKIASLSDAYITELCFSRDLLQSSCTFADNPISAIAWTDFGLNQLPLDLRSLSDTLETFSLSNAVLENLPDYLFDFPKLRATAFSSVRLPNGTSFCDGATLRSLAKLPALETLRLECGSDPLVPEVSELASLRTLYLTNVSGTLSSQANSLEMLASFAVYDSPQLVGSFPFELLQASQIQSLQLSSLGLSGIIPDNTKLDKMVILIITNTLLEGPVPASFFEQLRLVHKINLSSNKFNGTVPETLNKARDISVLSLDSNNFEGPLPTLEGLQFLERLDLSRNSFSGKLRPEWASNQNLRYIQLRDNNLEGSIPEEWGSLSKLQELDLRGNNITGGIPSSWSEALRNVVRLD